MSPRRDHFICVALWRRAARGSGLSFIDLGVPIPQPEWGAIMATGREYMASAWWITVFPGVMIALVVLGVNLFADGLRDALDPRLKQ
jgi:peptide/nickel transport system permease protein